MTRLIRFLGLPLAFAAAVPLAAAMIAAEVAPPPAGAAETSQSSRAAQANPAVRPTASQPDAGNDEWCRETQRNQDDDRDTFCAVGVENMLDDLIPSSRTQIRVNIGRCCARRIEEAFKVQVEP